MSCLPHTALIGLCSLCLVAAAPAAEKAGPLDLRGLTKQPDPFAGAAVGEGKAVLTSDRWAYLLTPDERGDFALGADVTVQEPATQARFFGESWSVWPAR